MATSLDCFLVDMTDVDVLYFKMIWALVMPTVYLTIFLLGYFVAVAMKLMPYRVAIVSTAFIYMFLYLHPTLV